MRTLLFMDKEEAELWQSFLRYDFILDEFLETGAFAVCPWHQTGASVAEALPELESLLGNEEEWRAIVLTDLRKGDLPVEEDAHYDNVFDFPENYGRRIDDKARESERPLVRLTQMLGGLPEKTSVAWPSRSDDGLEYLSGYGIDQQAPPECFDLAERYRLGLPRPQSIWCVSPREVDEDLARLRDAHGSSPAEELDFWQRNDYPASARFLVCDRPAACRRDSDGENEPARRSEWFRFWLGVLVLAVSNVEAAYLRPYRLHCLEALIDEEELDRVLARRYSVWAAAREAVGQQLLGESARLSTSEYVMVELPECDVTIPVMFDLVDEDKLYADAGEIGLFRDRPSSDERRWDARRKAIVTEFRGLLRAPRRSLSNAQALFQEVSALDEAELEACVLNEYQREELADGLQEQELALARSTGPQAFSFATYRGSFEKEGAKVSAALNRRPSGLQVAACLGVAVGCTVVGFAPYWTGFLDDAGVSAWAVGLTAATCLVLVAVALAVLFLQRWRARQAVRGFNTAMESVVSQLRGEASRLGRRVSSYATFRKRFSVLERQARRGEPSEFAAWLGHRDALLRTRMADLEALTAHCAVDPAVFGEAKRMEWDRQAALLADPSFFRICPSDSVSRPLNEGLPTEGSLEVPFAFIGSLRLETLTVR